MREHMGLYRGKLVDNGEWVEGSLVISRYETPTKSFDSYRIEQTTYGRDDDGFATYMSGYDEEVDPNTVGECTGLRDKNGKLIFEGDVLKYHEPFVMKSTGFVCCGENQWNGSANVGFYMKWVDAPLPDILRTDLGFWCNEREFEIIGNIHDNPELLKGERND